MATTGHGKDSCQILTQALGWNEISPPDARGGALCSFGRALNPSDFAVLLAHSFQGVAELQFLVP